MSIVAVLDVPLRADTSNLDAGLDKASKGVKDFATKTEASAAIGGAAIQGLSLRGVAMAAAVGGAAAAAGVAIVGYGQKLIQMGKDAMGGIAVLGKMADRFGVTTAALGGLEHMAVLSGLSFEELTANLTRFQRHLSEAAHGGGEAAAVFAQLGLQATELDKLSLDQSIGVFADAFNRFGNAADKTRVAMSLFGKAGASMKGFLGKGSEGIKQFTDEAQRLGLAVTGQQVADVRAASKAYKEFQQAMTGIGRSAAVILAPSFEMINRIMATVAKTLAGLGSDNVTFFRAFIDTGIGLAKAWGDAWSALNPIGNLLNLLGIDLAASIGTWGDWRDRILEILFTVQFVTQNWKQASMLAFDEVALRVVEFANSFVYAFTDTIPKAFQVLLDMFNEFGKGNWQAGIDKAMKGIGESLTRARTPIEEEILKRLEVRAKALGEDLGEYVRKKMEEFKRPRAIDVPAPPGATPAGGAPKVAAMEAGSKEAFSVIYGTQTAQQKALNVANEQLKENRKASVLLDKILRKGFGLRRAGL